MAHDSEYDFAVAMLNGDIENKLEVPIRDFIFEFTLSQFKNKPVKIFQVGAIATFRIAWRVGSGWADTIFGPYIENYGGKLTIADINLDNLSHSIFAASSLGYKIEAKYGDAIDYLDNDTYDIYYLDGGNDPQETLDQFNKIKDQKAIVIIDDYSIKGTLIPTDLDITIYDVANQVGIIDMRE